MKKMSPLAFILGGIAGTAVGLVAGVLLAPNSGAENRAMAADAVSDAWDSAVDAYEQGQQAVVGTYEQIRPSVDAKTDELRAKVDLARERMDQLRSTLTDTVTPTSIVIEDEEAEAPEAAEKESSTQVEIVEDGVELVEEPAEAPEA